MGEEDHLPSIHMITRSRQYSSTVERFYRNLKLNESNSQLSITHPEMSSDLLGPHLNLLVVQRRRPGTDALKELVQAAYKSPKYDNQRIDFNCTKA